MARQSGARAGPTRSAGIAEAPSLSRSPGVLTAFSPRIRGKPFSPRIRGKPFSPRESVGNRLAHESVGNRLAHKSVGNRLLYHSRYVQMCGVGKTLKDEIYSSYVC